LAFLIVLALAGLYGVAGLSHAVLLSSAVKPVKIVGRLQVKSAVVGCPAPGLGLPTGGNVAVASVPAGSGSGNLALTPLHVPTKAHPIKTVTSAPKPGQLTIKTIHQAPVVQTSKSVMPDMAKLPVPTSLANGGLVVAATGSSAQGFDVEQLGPSGQPSARCQTPGSDFWFVGPQTSKMRTELYLINADAKPADAHVGVVTDSGPRLGTQDSGILVPPHSVVMQDLGKLLHSAKAAALNVRTSTGRVVAAIRQTNKAGLPGIWLPPAPEPATTQMLTGLPDTPGMRELFISVPGGRAARVKVTAITPRGTYHPTGGNGISLLGRLTTSIALPSLGGFPGSVKITSNVPVTAVLEVSGGPTGSPGAFISSSAPITEQGVVAAGPVGAAGTSEIVLTAPAKAASVKISQATPGTPLAQQSARVVKISARSATKVKLKLPKNGSSSAVTAVLVTPLPGSGPVYAARLALSGGTVVGVLPIDSSPTRIDLPNVQESMLSVFGRQSSPG
jgi:hypothetical protein